MIKIDIPPKRRSYAMLVTLGASVLFHIGLWAVLTSWGNRPVSESYLVQLMIDKKKADAATPTPTPKPERKLAEATPPPTEKNLQQLLEQKTIEQQVKAELKFDRKIQTEVTTISNEIFKKRGSGPDNNEIPSIVTNMHGRGAGDPGPPAKMIQIGSGKRGGIGISTSGEGSISIGIGSGFGGGHGAGRGSGTGNGPDIPTVRLGGVGLGNGRGGGGGGGGGGEGPNLSNIGTGVRKAKVEQKVEVQVSNTTKQAAPTKTDVSGEWVVAEIAGPIAGYQIKCLNSPGYHVFGDVKIQCENDKIVAAWKRK